MVAATLGQYRVLGLIGQGGMGAVYAAEHTLLGRPAAIKVLLPELSQKQDVVMRFFNEARAATAIRHPGIIEIFDFGWTAEGAAYIVMEHLEGETLSRRSGRARFPWQAALAIVRQIAGALAAAHAKGIVHRDLKPENIFLVLDPEVPGGERIKLLDFGIAKLAGDTSPTVNVTRTGAVIGTPTYMAPEQCRGVQVDARADLYSLGCILFELCTGRPPFVGEGTGDVLAAHIHVPPPTLAALSVKVPAAVEQLVQRLLAKSPGQRVQAAEHLIREIDAITTERGHAAAVPLSKARPPTTSASDTTLSGAASTSRQMPAVGAPSQGRRIAIVSASAALISVVVVVLVMRRGDDGSIAALPQPVSHAAPREPVTVPPTAGGDGSEPTTPPAASEVATVSPAAGASPGAKSPPAGAPSAASPSPAPVSPPAAASPPPAVASSPPAAASSPPPVPASPPAAASSPPPVPASPPAAASSPAAASRPPASRPAEASLPARSPSPAAAARPPVARPSQIASSSPAGEPPPRPRSSSAPGSAVAATAVSVDVESVPPGAQVLFAGTLLGKTPFHGTLPRRDRDVTLVIRFAGHADKSVVVHTDKDIRERVKLVRTTSVQPRGNRDQSVNPFAN